MFHQINELMVLGMHPAIQCPRRSQGRPLRVRTAAGSSVPPARSIVADELNRVLRTPTPILTSRAVGITSGASSRSDPKSRLAPAPMLRRPAVGGRAATYNRARIPSSEGGVIAAAIIMRDFRSCSALNQPKISRRGSLKRSARGRPVVDRRSARRSPLEDREALRRYAVRCGSSLERRT